MSFRRHCRCRVEILCASRLPGAFFNKRCFERLRRSATLLTSCYCIRIFFGLIDIVTVFINSKWRLKHFLPSKAEKLHVYQLHILNLHFGDQLIITTDLVRRIGFLKEIINKRISDAPENMNRTDIRLRLF